MMIQAPSQVGPTGPAQVTVMTVATGGTCVNLTEPKFGPLKDAIDRAIPLMVVCEGSNVGYRYGNVGSGLIADPNMTVIGPTAANMCGTILGNTRLAMPEFAPPGSNGLALTAFGSGGTATIRMWRIG